LRWLKSCASCGSYQAPIDGFCRNCMSALLLQTSNLHLTSMSSFSCLSLFKWNDQNEKAGLLVKALKGRNSRMAYAKLAIDFMGRLGKPVKPNSLLVVPPSKRGDSDHAHAFALGIATLTGQTVVSPFISSQVDQKKLSKSERILLKYKVKSPVRSEAFIFVDDLLTTGSTARAAWNALGRPKHFSAWTLACRPLQKLL
jgi:predicted amidophosphoribosyltransferase